MRILLDGAISENNLGGKVYPYILEASVVTLDPEFVKSDIPDKLEVVISTYDDEIRGKYPVDGTKEALDKALSDYNKALDILLTKGYAKLNDFGNVEWY